MQGLLALPNPSNNLASLHSFHDGLENHIRGFSALHQSKESYSVLLVPIILPTDVRRNLAWDHPTFELIRHTRRSHIEGNQGVWSGRLHQSPVTDWFTMPFMPVLIPHVTSLTQLVKTVCACTVRVLTLPQTVIPLVITTSVLTSSRRRDSVSTAWLSTEWHSAHPVVDVNNVVISITQVSVKHMPIIDLL